MSFSFVVFPYFRSDFFLSCARFCLFVRRFFTLAHKIVLKTIVVHDANSSPNWNIFTEYYSLIKCEPNSHGKKRNIHTEIQVNERSAVFSLVCLCCWCPIFWCWFVFRTLFVDYYYWIWKNQKKQRKCRANNTTRHTEFDNGTKICESHTANIVAD